MTLTPGARLGSFEIRGPLGAGGMGEVWLAHDTRLERDVALKVLPQRFTRDSRAMERFRHEALALASLNHPNVATIHGIEPAPDGSMILVLECVEGESLAARLKRGPLPIAEALRVCAQIAQALEVAHERGVIHRDMKPGNVMLGPRGLVKVLDFGLAKRTRGLIPLGGSPTERVESPEADSGRTPESSPPAADGRPGAEDAPTLAAGTSPITDSGPLSFPGSIVGTPGYMSPEQVMAGALDTRTDIFAFGCILYECLTGHRAFSGEDVHTTMASVLLDAVDVTVLPEQIPPRVRALIESCLEKDAQRRPANIGDVRQELEESIGRQPVAGRVKAGTTPHNLPPQATSFVGRDETLRDCRRLLETSRLVTLTGLGGCGKTRVALKIAESRIEVHPDGVWFVDLALISDPARAIEVVAGLLQVRDEPGKSLLESVTAALSGRRPLLLFDNCETMTAAVAGLASHLLGACPDLRILATSREPLGLEAEAVFILPSLSVPDGSVAADLDAITSCDAVRLFAERAAVVHPGFEMGSGNAPVIAEICRRVDGIPLAIELAAGRVRMLGVDQIRDRLDDRFRLLTSSGRAGAARQQALLATIQWSWDHLATSEQNLMRRLAVFTGSWTLERATRVCSDDGDEFEVLDLLTRLVERSLVVVRHGADGSVRYRFLESVWRFALGILENHVEHSALRERHFDEYLAFAERVGTAVRGAEAEKAMREIDPEEENLLSALAWSSRLSAGAVRGLQFVSHIHRFWSFRGRYTLGERLLREALDRDTDRKPLPVRADVLTRFAGFAMVLGHYDGVQGTLEESLAICQTVGDEMGRARAFAGLSVVAMCQNRPTEALENCHESLNLYKRLGRRLGVAMSLHNIATIEYGQRRGDHGRAHAEEALALLRQEGDSVTEALCLVTLSGIYMRTGSAGEAGDRLRECFALLKVRPSPRETIFALESSAEWLIAHQRYSEAARLSGAAASARVDLGISLMPMEKSEREELIARLSAALGSAEYERLSDLGGRESLSDSLAEAAAAIGPKDSREGVRS